MKTLYSPLLLVALLVSSCATENAGRKVTSISLSEVQGMLSTQLTCSDVEMKLGSPLVQPQGNWGNLMYELPERKYLFFHYKGPYVYAASYDNIPIKGVEPKTYQMHFIFDSVTEGYLCALDNETFQNIDSLEDRLKNLPKDSIVEWQINDVRFIDKKEPISSMKEIEKFEDYCREIGIILIKYPGG